VLTLDAEFLLGDLEKDIRPANKFAAAFAAPRRLGLAGVEDVNGYLC
jgi:hypothetical protein